MTGRRTRDRGKQLLHTGFRLGQRLGLDILPRHFYSSVPDLRELERSEAWREASSMPGVAGTDLADQVQEATRWFTPAVRAHLAEVDVHADAVQQNGADGYGPMEAQFLHAFVATNRPARVVQVGAGVSTAVILDAADAHGLDVEVTCVDPYPTALLRRLADEGRITLVEEPAQTVDLGVLTALGDGDLLFIDSTHTVKPGSEVNRLVLEVLPRLGKGVTVHVHDIMFPFDHPVDLLEGRLFFWDESTLLHAWLVDNRRAAIRLSESMLVHGAESTLKELLVGYRPPRLRGGLFDGPRGDAHFPSATWVAID